MKPIPIGLPLGSEPGRTTHDGAQRLVNLYSEDSTVQGKTQTALWVVDGLRQKLTFENGGPCRGLFAIDETAALAVANTSIYKITNALAVTNIGSLTGVAPVSFARNMRSPNPQVMLVSEGQRLLYEAGAVAPIADTDLPSPHSVGFMDGSLLAGIADGRFFFSALNDGNAWAALDVATAEASPDPLRRLYVRNREVWLMGTKSIEVWTDTGDITSPFQRLPGVVIQTGLGAQWSVADIEGTMIFVDDKGSVRMASQYAPERISSHAVERSIDAERATWDRLVAFAYTSRGHQFYVLNGLYFSWVFDFTTGRWHEEESYGLSRRKWAGYMFFANMHLVGDHASGALYEIASDAYDDAGDHLVASAQMHVHAYPSPIELNELYIDVIPGVGIDSADEDDADPKLMLRTSRNGGETFGAQRFLPMGRSGKHTQRVKATRFGTSNEDGFVIEASSSARVVRGLTGAAALIQRVSP